MNYKYENKILGKYNHFGIQHGIQENSLAQILACDLLSSVTMLLFRTLARISPTSNAKLVQKGRHQSSTQEAFGSILSEGI